MRSSRWNRLSFVCIHAGFRIYAGPGRENQTHTERDLAEVSAVAYIKSRRSDAMSWPSQGQWPVVSWAARWLGVPLAGSYLLLLPFQFPHADVPGLCPRGPLRRQPGLCLRRERVRTHTHTRLAARGNWRALRRQGNRTTMCKAIGIMV